MRWTALSLAFLASAGYGFEIAGEKQRHVQKPETLSALAKLLMAFNPTGHAPRHCHRCNHAGARSPDLMMSAERQRGDVSMYSRQLDTRNVRPLIEIREEEFIKEIMFLHKAELEMVARKNLQLQGIDLEVEDLQLQEPSIKKADTDGIVIDEALCSRASQQCNLHEVPISWPEGMQVKSLADMRRAFATIAKKAYGAAESFEEVPVEYQSQQQELSQIMNTMNEEHDLVPLVLKQGKDTLSKFEVVHAAHMVELNYQGFTLEVQSTDSVSQQDFRRDLDNTKVSLRWSFSILFPYKLKAPQEVNAALMRMLREDPDESAKTRAPRSKIDKDPMWRVPDMDAKPKGTQIIYPEDVDFDLFAEPIPAEPTLADMDDEALAIDVVRSAAVNDKLDRIMEMLRSNPPGSSFWGRGQLWHRAMALVTSTMRWRIHFQTDEELAKKLKELQSFLDVISK